MERTYFYARISRKTQSIERQITNCKKEYPDAVIYQEAFTGTRIERPEWTKLLKQIDRDLRHGDTVTLVFDSVSRMSRNAEEGFKVYEDLYSKGVNLVFLKEHHIDTDTYKKAMKESIPLTGTELDYLLEGINKYLLALARKQIRLAFNQAEKEVEDLRQRTKEGIREARKNGKQIGQKTGRILNIKKKPEKMEMIKKYSKDFDGSLSDADAMKLVGVARNTYYKYKKELRESL